MKFTPLATVESYSLPNGLEVYLKPDRRWPVFSLHVWVKAGSVDEPGPRAGMAHILEHMVFKGTTRFKADEISRFIEAQGGVMNAETSKEYTHYFIDIPSAGAQQTVQLLAELTHRATLDEEEWKRECPVILEEMKRRQDDPDVRLWDQFQDVIYGTKELQRAVIGTAETVSSVTIQDLREFYTQHYTAGRSVVSAAGDFDTATMKAWIAESFGSMPQGQARERRVWGPQQQAPTEKSVKDHVRQCYIAMGVRTPTAEHPDQEPLDLLAAVLGEGRNSRLIDTLREKKRLVWSVSAMHYTQEGPGFFGVFAECDPKKRAAYRRELDKILLDVQRRPPKSDEISRSKNLIQTAWLQGWETAHNQAATIGHHALDRQMPRLKSYMPKLMAVTAADIQRVAKKYLSQPRATLWIEPS